MTARLRASAGRRKTSPSPCSPERPTMSRWASPTSSSRPRRKRTRPAWAPASLNRTTSSARTLTTATATRSTTRFTSCPTGCQFQLMMRFIDAPQPDPNPSASAIRGKTVFNTIGCSLCHTPQMQTAPVLDSAVLENRPVNLYSDLLVHHMGAGLADNIIQTFAGPDEFRTTPLWGIGQRLFFLHDGRTSDLLAAIQAHYSASTLTSAGLNLDLLGLLIGASATNNGYPASEANAAIQKFNALSVSDKQAILDFLRSL